MRLCDYSFRRKSSNNSFALSINQRLCSGTKPAPTIKIAHQSWEKENTKDSCFCMISFHLAAISLDQLIVFATIVTLHGSDLDIYQLHGPGLMFSLETLQV